ncbi:MAG TPA: RNA polymerase factor sigma-54 [Luteimonas sp.]|nr:RNA polymerase factor sigma-54 [Luteimonas sp.]
MKPRLQTSLGQHLVLTPQLRQAIHLLQLSATELGAELAAAVESNPLLDWAEAGEAGPDDAAAPGAEAPAGADGAADEWREPAEAWTGGAGGGEDDRDPAERMAAPETLRDHLLWQLHLSHLSPRDRRIAEVLIDAIDEDGYLRESLAALREALGPGLAPGEDEVLAVLHQLQRFDPPGVGARDLGECLALQLALLPEDTPGRAIARRIAAEAIERLPRAGVAGLAPELQCSEDEVAEALALLRSLDPRPGGQVGSVEADSYVVPDATVWREHGTWRVALSSSHAPRLTIHRGYEAMIGAASSEDASYLRSHLQEARWLLKNLQQRGETLLKVVRCLVRQQSGFLEFGDQALRPLTLREVATEVGVHESTVSRAVARKYVRTPRGTLPLRAFFASGIDTGAGGGASSTAIQSMIRRLVEAEDPRKPLSDARLAEALKAAGVPVARRTVAKYREAMNIPSSQDRLRPA